MSNIGIFGWGPLPWNDVFMLVWLFLTAISVVYVTWDSFTNNPELKVMKWGWILVTLYLGPVSAVLYVLSCKEPSPGTHQEFVQPLWRQAVGSTIHCVAGDATGIIVAAAITSALGLPMWIDLIVEYLAGFSFGLLIFQSLFMKDMMGGSYTKALKHSLLPEWLSMNMMMTGMFPTMILLMMGRDMRAMEPNQLVFWGVMSIAVGIGYIVAYPINAWLVYAGLKHGMGTERVFGKGGNGLEAVRRRLSGLAQPANAQHGMAMAHQTSSGQGRQRRG